MSTPTEQIRERLIKRLGTEERALDWLIHPQWVWATASHMIAKNKSEKLLKVLELLDEIGSDKEEL